MYEVAVLWIVNEHGELLLAKRSDTKQHDPSLWGPSVTGKREANETVEQAVIRETTEELGLGASLYQPHFLFEEDFAHPDGVVRKFSIYYTVIAKKVVEDSLRLDPEEVAGTKWLTAGELRDLLATDGGATLPTSALSLWEKVLSRLDKRKGH